MGITEVDVTQGDSEGIIAFSPVGIEIYREIPKTEHWKDNLWETVRFSEVSLSLLKDEFWKIKMQRSIGKEYLSQLSLFWEITESVLKNYLGAKIEEKGDDLFGFGVGGGLILLETKPERLEFIYKFLDQVFGSPEFKEHLSALKEYENI